MFVTEWESLRRVQQFKLPYKQRNAEIQSIMIKYSYQANILGIIENETPGGYRLGFWEIKNNTVNLLFLNEVEHTGLCRDILYFESVIGAVRFAITEESCIKFWKFESEQAILTNKIFLKTNLIAASISSLTGLFCFVDALGKAVFLNSAGNLITQITHPEESFMSVNLDDIYAYIGCSSGALCIYHLNSFRLHSIYPYLGSLKKKHQLRQNEVGLTSTFGPSIIKITKSHQNNLLGWKHADGTIIIFDCERKKVIEYQIAHDKRIEDVLWIPGRSEFLTASSDGYLMSWELINDKWIPKMLDVSNQLSLEMSSDFYHNKNGVPLKSEEDVINERGNSSIKSVAFNQHKSELLIGDRLGNLFIFDYTDYSMTKKISLGQFGIEKLHLSPKGSLLGVVFVTGEAALYDCTRNYQRVQDLEAPFDDYTIKASNVFKSIQLIQDELERATMFEAFSGTNRSAIGNSSKTINYRKFYVKNEVALKVVTSHNSNTLHLQQIYKDDLTISRSIKIKYCLEGKCSGFIVHPSNNYLLALSNIGLLYIFKLINGDVRLKIDIPSYSSNLFLDPSGLYCIFSGYEEEIDDNGFSNQKTSKLARDFDYILSKPPKKELNTSYLVEIGTGEIVGSIPYIYDISAGAFSPEGDYVVLGSNYGHVGVWLTEENIADNVSEVLAQMKMNPRFWNDYPIMPTSDELNPRFSDKNSQDNQQEYQSVSDIDEESIQNQERTLNNNLPNRNIKFGDRYIEKSTTIPRAKPPPPINFSQRPAFNSRPRFYEEKRNQGPSITEQSMKRNTETKEHKFLRNSNVDNIMESLQFNAPDRVRHQPVRPSPSNSILGKKYTIPQSVLMRGGQSKEDKVKEINKRLLILQKEKQERLNMLGQNNPDEARDRMIYSEPSDIDYDYEKGEDLTENNSVYADDRPQRGIQDLDNFEVNKLKP